MVQHRRFLDMALDEEGLHTPDGTLALSAITKAELVRNFSHSGGGTESRTSGADIAGGALLGGLLAGPVGVLGGAVLGSTVRSDSPIEGAHRSTSATLIFESPDLAYTVTVSRDRLVEAEGFAAAVKQAAHG
ncbi:MAG: hypothetical protein KJ747_08085 [Actinobacteria bacterium]|nr:hypothetical protein [Actinomycetota bacterium]